MLLFAVMHVKAYKVHEFNFVSGQSAEPLTQEHAALEDPVPAIDVSAYTYRYWSDLRRDMKSLREKAQEQKKAAHLIARDDTSDEDLQWAFNAFDHDTDGCISSEQLRYLLECAGVDAETINNIAQKLFRNADTVNYSFFRNSLVMA